ncbi:MAG: HAD family phosphatase [Dehalococcoidales bacterium]|nr:HAD family phosphatase [Dehalococcoidales bacterium]
MAKNEVKAVIWDMDGIIANTALYHLKGWQIVFQNRQITYTEEEYRLNTGKRSDNIVRDILGEKITEEEINIITRTKAEAFRKLISQNVETYPGVIKLVTSLKEYGFKTAIASSAPMANIELITKDLKIHDYFDFIISGWDITRSKPDPEIFLLAAQNLGAEAKNCIVIEDAIVGVAACRRAGMHCIAVTNTNPREDLQGADLIIDSLEEITIDDLNTLLNQHK